MMNKDAISLTNTISKAEGNEALSLTYASLKDAAGREADTISTERLQAGNTILDIYTIASDAISGGMGSVWRVHHEGWNIDLAMKRPQPRFFAEGSRERKENFIRECENWIYLGLHPCIVSCYYVRDIGGVPSIFSEWMDGGSLRDRIMDGTLYEGTADAVQERILDIAIQSANGLMYSHRNGLLHLDMKPGNLLLTKDWDAKISDFGLSNAKSELGDRTAGFTREYCSREQAEGTAPARWMDVYAWALTVLEMYAGGRLWESGEEAARNCASYFERCQWFIPGKMQQMILRCLTDKRYDFEELLPQLEQIYSEVTGNAYPRENPGKAAADSADSLNNRALSFLDLGMPDRAREIWQNALKIVPGHPASVYNLGLMEWRDAKIDDMELLRRCEQSGSDYSSSVTDRLVKQIRLERADITDHPLSDGRIPPGQLEERKREDLVPPAENYADPNLGTIYKRPDGNRYFCFNKKSEEIVLTDAACQPLITIRNPHHKNLYKACFSEDGNTIYVGGIGYLAFLDTETLRWDEITLHGTVSFIYRSSEGRYMIAGDSDADRIVDVRNHRILLTLENRDERLVDLIERDDLVQAVFSVRHEKDFRVIENRFPGPAAPWELCRIRNIMEAESDKARADILEGQLREAIDRNDMGQAIALLEEAEKLGGTFRFLKYRRRIYARCSPKELIGIYEINHVPLPEEVTPHSMAFHPVNGKLAVSHRGSMGSAITFLDNGLLPCGSFFTDTADPPSVFFSDSGELLICAYSGSYTQIRDAESGKIRMRVGETGAQATGIRAIDPEDRLLLTHTDGTTTFWTIPEGKVRKRMKHPLTHVHDVCFLKDGRTVWGREDGKIQITNTYHLFGRTSCQLFEDDEPVYSVLRSRNGETLFANYDDYIAVVDVRTMEKRAELTLPFDRDFIITFCRMAVSADGLLLAAARGYYIHLWSLPDRELIQSFRIPDRDIVQEVHFSPEGSLLCARCKNSFRIWVLRRRLE